MIIRQLIAALHNDAAPPSRRYRGSMGLSDAGELVELLANPQPTRCPHCNEWQPPVQLRTRRRKLYALRSAAGAILHLEIQP